MKLRLFTALFAVGLGACGGGSPSGGSAGPAEASGIFAGSVKGLHYRTPTRSGTTDSSGTFRYLPGETVTFSIGAIQLGAAPGAARISPFTLVGLTPPATELALRTELDLARSAATPFTRAVNIQHLLMVLDVDHNPANGLDVSGRDAALANSSIDLDFVLVRFAARAQFLVADATRNIPLSRSVAELYRAVSISVAVHAPTREVTDIDTLVPQTDVTDYSYDAEGLRLGLREDMDGDGNPDSLTTNTYDVLGRMTQTETSHSQSSGPLLLAYALANEYDGAGNQVGQTSDLDSDGDGSIDDHFVASYSLDDRGRVSTQQASRDLGSDGQIDQTFLARLGYDARNNLTSVLTENDENADGSVDSRSSHTFVYDAQDHNTRYVREQDVNDDGEADTREVDVTEYAAGLAVRRITESDFDADGVIDSRRVTSWTYDAAGNPLTTDTQNDYGADGIIEDHSRSESTYDQRHHVLTQLLWSDFDGDGDAELNLHFANTYNSTGGPLSSVFEYDTNGYPSQTTTEYQYGAGGERLGYQMVSTTSGPYVIRGNPINVVTNAEFPNGVLLLAQQYLELNAVEFVTGYVAQP